VCTKLSKTFIAADCHSDERAKKDFFFPQREGDI
jgi:hypothetical protein